MYSNRLTQIQNSHKTSSQKSGKTLKAVFRGFGGCGSSIRHCVDVGMHVTEQGKVVVVILKWWLTFWKESNGRSEVVHKMWSFCLPNAMSADVGNAQAFSGVMWFDSLEQSTNAKQRQSCLQMSQRVQNNASHVRCQSAITIWRLWTMLYWLRAHYGDCRASMEQSSYQRHRINFSTVFQETT